MKVRLFSRPEKSITACVTYSRLKLGEPCTQVAANGKAPHAPDTLAVAWNNKADHILASWAGGVLTVHDLKQQRPRCNLKDDNR